MAKAFVKSQLPLLEFIVDNVKNEKQVRAVLERVDASQYSLLREIAANALEGVLVTPKVRPLIEKDKKRLKKLRRGTLNKNVLGRMIPLLRRLVRLALRYHEFR